jgi:broad specificity phosphatase PhoE
MIDVWFESHGTTLDNEAKKASGWNDVDLSELGMKQAKELLDRARERNITAIFCSDLQRSVKTAIPTAEALQIPIYVDRRLRECDYGDMTGQQSSIIEAERPKRIDTPFPNGQSLRQCVLAMEAFCTELRQSFDNKTILIIGHRATQYGLEVFGAGKTLEEKPERAGAKIGARLGPCLPR